MFPTINRIKECRHGTMVYNIHDMYIGRSLDLYGEFSEGEIALFSQFIRPGHVIVEAGANMGAHTVWFGKQVGPQGAVLAFEPQRIIFQLLNANIALNQLTNVHAMWAALGQRPGLTVVPQLDYGKQNNFGGLSLGEFQNGQSVEVRTIDRLNLPQCDFIKVDVEGMEQDVLAGATQTIAKHQPALYVENDREDKARALTQFIDALGYNMYWHTPLLFSSNNFAGNPQNVFGGILSRNMLCLPKSRKQQISGLKPVEVVTD
ncbi:hypothetical protein SV7mr_14980 [Stieleria bergensis]|uniref:Methyltransferase FkbM domain-containing protein n=1 Tax=Stieleria bergensis TaxID=2528025 RepID=A0A517SS83_9BACT|nr:hypothetical protein SV7mr_14980 [Planctomycetes bacterium SV_7m_r]